jgi:hypothetical protein
MRHHFEFDREREILLLIVEGDVRDADIQTIAISLRLGVAEFNPSAGITDFSGVTSFEVSGDCMSWNARNSSPFRNLTPHFIVAPSDHVFGLSRMFQILRGRPALYVVRSRREALEALDVPTPAFESAALRSRDELLSTNLRRAFCRAGESRQLTETITPGTARSA